MARGLWGAGCMVRGLKRIFAKGDLMREALERRFEAAARWLWLALKLTVWWGFLFGCLLGVFFALSAMRGLLAAIPLEIQAACVLLIVLALTLLLLMLRERRRALEALELFLSALEDLPTVTQKERTQGLSAARAGEFLRRGKGLRGKPREWWAALEESLEAYAGPDGQTGWFITRPASEILPEEDVISPFYHASFHQAVPGILTALGLLATFVAILVALSRVTYDAGEVIRPVSGIDQLINGLAGKFLSSIIALVVSIIFTFIEKKICEQQLLARYREMIKRCKQTLPVLSQSRILLDIQRLLGGRAAAAGLWEPGRQAWEG